MKILSDEAKDRIADALGCGECVCREDCLNSKPFKSCPHSETLPRLIIVVQEAEDEYRKQVVERLNILIGEISIKAGNKAGALFAAQTRAFRQELKGGDN